MRRDLRRQIKHSAGFFAAFAEESIHAVARTQSGLKEINWSRWCSYFDRLLTKRCRTEIAKSGDFAISPFDQPYRDQRQPLAEAHCFNLLLHDPAGITLRGERENDD